MNEDSIEGFKRIRGEAIEGVHKTQEFQKGYEICYQFIKIHHVELKCIFEVDI